jgi:leader peptidase (prepilin peptidase)/N-methyltransferase
MAYPESILFFVLGLVFGSFLNACIYRLPRGKSILWPGSHCPACKAPIKPWDNIPLVSYLFLLGCCRACKTKIGWRYPFVEGLTGLLFVGLYVKFGMTAQIIAWLALGALLIAITFIDIEFQLILNKITIPGLVLGLMLSWQLIEMNLLQIAFGALIGGGLLVGIAFMGKMLFGKESMGMGDVKMAAMIGVFLGAKGIAIALFFGFLIAGLFSFAGLAMKKLQRSSYLPFGPFIAAGTFLYIFWGEDIVRWYLKSVGIA